MRNVGSYPNTRMRRNRKTDWSRRLVQESNLSTNDLIWPIFIRDGRNIKEPIKTMPGVYRYSLDKIENLDNLNLDFIGINNTSYITWDSNREDNPNDLDDDNEKYKFPTPRW